MRDPRLSKLYSVRFAPDEKERKDRVWRVLCRHFFQRYIEPESTVLDIGAGYCEFINHIVCHRRIAFDLDEHVRAHAGPGVEVVQGVSTDLHALQSGVIDVVFASNFFEHLPSKEDLLRTLAEVHRVLRQGGRLLILQPNIRYTSGAYWDFFDHHLPLTERSLVEALELVGLKPTEVRPQSGPELGSDSGCLPPLAGVGDTGAVVVVGCLSRDFVISPTVPGLEPSFVYAFKHSAAQKLWWGHDFVSTYGPYGHLLSTMDIGGVAVRKTGRGSSRAAATYVWREVDLPARARVALLAGLLYALDIQSMKYQCLAFLDLVLLIGIRSRDRTSVVVFGLAEVVAGLYVLIKSSLGLGALLTVAAGCLLDRRPSLISVSIRCGPARVSGRMQC